MKNTQIIPIFPLAIVQFPLAETSLHIFEPRYRQMLTDVMAGDETFGIVLHQAGRLSQVGCTVGVSGVETLADGRSNISCVGRSRFRLLEVVDDEHTPYARAEVELLEDDLLFEDDALMELVSRLRDLFSRLYTADQRLRGQGESRIVDALPVVSAMESEVFSYFLADYLQADLVQKQRWLEMTSTQVRLRDLEVHLHNAVQVQEQRVKVSQVSRTNGHGGHLPLAD